MSVENDPLFVFFTGDDSQDIYPGYQWDKASEELIKTDILVDEEYALTHEVWVISINERMDQADGSIMDESNLTNVRTQSSPSAYVDQIKCKCHKESWAAGRSEVHMLLVVSDWSFENGDLQTYGKGDHEGGQIYKFKRKDVRKERNKDVNFLILNNWDDRAPGMPWGNYVIFEYDTWPTALRKATWTHGNETYDWEYRSDDDYYDLKTVYNSNFSNHYVNEPCIEWRSQYY